jgi:hypothetical protein
MSLVRWPEEVNGEYSVNFYKVPFSIMFTETEELIIEKSHRKISERKIEEKMTSRERFGKNFFSDGPIDRLPICISGGHNIMPRIFDAFGDPPSTLGQRDMINHPNLDFVGQMIWQAKWWFADLFAPMNYSYSEEVLSRRFRMIEYGPPLSVEPLVKTKEDAQFFMDNMPDPALAGTYPAYLWEVKQQIKHLPELVSVGSVCPGTISGASFLRGIRNFLIDVRKNMEMAEMVVKCTSKWLHKKIDRMVVPLGEQLDENGKGNILWWCDAASFLNLEEFTKLMPLTYGTDVPYAAKKGWKIGIAPEAPVATMDLISKCVSENGGSSGILSHPEQPPIEDWYRMTRKYDNVPAFCDADVKAILDGPKSHILESWKRQARAFAQYPTKGLRTYMLCPFDPTTPMEHMEYAAKSLLEVFKYPVEA